MSEEEPRTPEQIAEDCDVPLPAVLEAIAYCESDPPEIRDDPNYGGKPKHVTPQQRAQIYNDE